MELYRVVSNVIEAIKRCKAKGSEEWENTHTKDLADLLNKRLPCGSGFDGHYTAPNGELGRGCSLDFKMSTSECLVFNASYHHMNNQGMYCGWSEHTVKVTPSLAHGFNLKISGPNKRDIKTYIGELFSEILHDEVGDEKYE